jgi:regulator of protease activity HflC (stomatin/prohibitin superfamily)
MVAVYVIAVLILVVAVIGLAMSVRVIKQYERVVLFKLGKVKDKARGPGLIFIFPFVDRVHRVSLRIITMPIQSQGIITKDNVSIDVSAVAYYRVEDAIRSVIAIENVESAINQIAQTTLRAGVGRHTLDETLSETDTINQNIREILDVQTEEWGIKVTVVELRDIQLPESMKRAMARQAEAEREKRAKIIAAQGEALAAGELAAASDVMMAHPLALQLRNLQTLVEVAVAARDLHLGEERNTLSVLAASQNCSCLSTDIARCAPPRSWQRMGGPCRGRETSQSPRKRPCGADESGLQQTTYLPPMVPERRAGQ